MDLHLYCTETNMSYLYIESWRIYTLVNNGSLEIMHYIYCLFKCILFWFLKLVYKRHELHKFHWKFWKTQEIYAHLCGFDCLLLHNQPQIELNDLNWPLLFLTIQWIRNYGWAQLGSSYSISLKSPVHCQMQWAELGGPRRLQWHFHASGSLTPAPAPGPAVLKSSQSDLKTRLCRPAELPSAGHIFPPPPHSPGQGEKNTLIMGGKGNDSTCGWMEPSKWGVDGSHPWGLSTSKKTTVNILICFPNVNFFMQRFLQSW